MKVGKPDLILNTTSYFCVRRRFLGVEKSPSSDCRESNSGLIQFFARGVPQRHLFLFAYDLLVICLCWARWRRARFLIAEESILISHWTAINISITSSSVRKICRRKLYHNRLSSIHKAVATGWQVGVGVKLNIFLHGVRQKKVKVFCRSVRLMSRKCRWKVDQILWF